MNSDQMRRVLNELSMAFPKSKPLGDMDEATRLWMKDFSSIDADDMALAVAAWIDEGEWFPTIKSFRKVLQRVSRQRVPEENCRCDGCGYYDASHTGKSQWVPCPACLPETHERWRGGHFAPGHHCEACNKARRGDGPSQPVEEQSLVPRSAGRKLSVEENLERLAIVQKVLGEIAEVRDREGPSRDRRVSPAEKTRYWEERFNAHIVGDTIRSPGESEALTLDILEPAEPAVDEFGFEVL